MNKLITLTALAACIGLNAAALASNDSDCLKKAIAQTGSVRYHGTLNIGTDAWGKDYNHATVFLGEGTGRSALFLACHSDDCVDSHYGGNMSVTSCAIEGNHYEIQMRSTQDGQFAAALQIPLQGQVPVSPIKIDASTSVAGISPSFDSSTAFTPLQG